MHLFSETVSPKNHGQVCLYIKGYKDKLLVSFTATTPYITTATHRGEKISSISSKLRKVFATKLQSSFCVSYRRVLDVVMQKW